MKKIKEKYTKSIFENIKHVDTYDNEFWYVGEITYELSNNSTIYQTNY